MCSLARRAPFMVGAVLKDAVRGFMQAGVLEGGKFFIVPVPIGRWEREVNGGPVEQSTSSDPGERAHL